MPANCTVSAKPVSKPFSLIVCLECPAQSTCRPGGCLSGAGIQWLRNPSCPGQCSCQTRFCVRKSARDYQFSWQQLTWHTIRSAFCLPGHFSKSWNSSEEVYSREASFCLFADSFGTAPGPPFEAQITSWLNLGMVLSLALSPLVQHQIFRAVVMTP